MDEIMKMLYWFDENGNKKDQPNKQTKENNNNKKQKNKHNQNKINTKQRKTYCIFILKKDHTNQLPQSSTDITTIKCIYPTRNIKYNMFKTRRMGDMNCGQNFCDKIIKGKQTNNS